MKRKINTSRFMGLLLAAFLTVGLIFAPITNAAYTTYNCDALTGGGARALDLLSVGDLTTGDRAIVANSGEFLYFVYDSTATAAENVSTHPYVVRPDDYSTSGNWEEQVPAGTGDVSTDEIWDAAGDLIQGIGADTAARLAKGGALALLRMNAGATAVEWGAGGQILFPATAVPSADPNTLDDYEKGTFSPDLQFGGAKVGITYADQNGDYVKTGDGVIFLVTISLTSKGTSVGVATISDFPFTTLRAAASSLRLQRVSFANFPQALLAATTLSLTEVLEDGTKTDITNADFLDNSNIYISGSYIE